MPSPFPGMDPWLENRECFPDVHDTLAIYLRDEINSKVPSGYIARAKTRIYHESEHSEPDVMVRSSKSKPKKNGALAVLPGYRMYTRTMEDTHEETYLEIRSTTRKRLVTAIEILSRSNKTPGTKGRKKYLKKQREYIQGKVNLVEIDLLRRGEHSTLAPLDQLKLSGKPFHYHVCATRGSSPEVCHVAMIALDEELPKISIPLEGTVKPILIDLQELFTKVYDNGLYAEDLDYTQPLDDDLTASEKSWVHSVLKSKRKLRK